MEVEELKEEIQDLLDHDDYDWAHDLLKRMMNEGEIRTVHRLFISAVYDKNIPLLEFLLDDIIDVNDRIFGKYYPLSYPISANYRDHDYINILRFLLDHGANPNLDDFLKEATDNGYLDFLNELLNYGANPNKRDSYGKTPLFHLKSGPNQIEMAKMLINAGADIFIVDKNGDTVLIDYYYRDDNYNLMEFFLRMGLDPNIQNKDGETILMIATESWKYEVVQLLIDYGADPFIKDLKGRNSFSRLPYGYYDDFRARKTLNILKSVKDIPTIKEPEDY